MLCLDAVRRMLGCVALRCSWVRVGQRRRQRQPPALFSPSTTPPAHALHADNIYITNLDDPNVLSFVDELQRRLRSPGGSSTFNLGAGSASHFGGSESSSAAALAPGGGGGDGDGAHPMPPGLTPRLSMTAAAPENLPFELRVLEIALDTVAKHLEVGWGWWGGWGGALVRASEGRQRRRQRWQQLDARR